MFHLTRRDRLAAILREGLRPGREMFFTDSVAGEMHLAAYGGMRPIYLSRVPWMLPADYQKAAAYGKPGDFVLLEVDVAGLPLVADIPSLADKGAYLEEDHLWFKESGSPLAAFEVDDQIEYERLLREPDLIAAANDLTGTAASLLPIESGRLRVHAA